MKKIIQILLIAVVVVAAGCKSGSVRAPKQFVDAPTSVVINSVIPFKEGHTIKPAIISDCALDTKLSTFIVEAGGANGVDIKASNQVTKDTQGGVLLVEITDSVSAGNAFIGHRKYTEIKGTLFNNGVEIASFRASRRSSGGAFGGFKSSCAILGRTVKVLGTDVTSWLKKPWKNGFLGDM